MVRMGLRSPPFYSLSHHARALVLSLLDRDENTRRSVAPKTSRIRTRLSDPPMVLYTRYACES